MRKEEKDQIINELAEKLSQYNNFYITDVSTLTVEKSNQLRRLCFSKGIKMQVAKNTLIKKAMEKSGKYDGLFETLTGSTAIMFSETGNVPAKIIKDFRKKASIPSLKGAYIDSDIYIGDNQLDALVSIKSKNELIADVIAMLLSPARTVIGALQAHADKQSAGVTAEATTEAPTSSNEAPATETPKGDAPAAESQEGGDAPTEA